MYGNRRVMLAATMALVGNRIRHLRTPSILGSMSAMSLFRCASFRTLVSLKNPDTLSVLWGYERVYSGTRRRETVLQARLAVWSAHIAQLY